MLPYDTDFNRRWDEKELIHYVEAWNPHAPNLSKRVESERRDEIIAKIRELVNKDDENAKAKKEEWTEKIFIRVDSDGNGLLNETEVRAIQSEIGTENNDQTIEKIFKVIDINEDQ